MWPTEKLPVTDLTGIHLFGLVGHHEEEAHHFVSPVQHNVDDLLADGVVAAGVVVGCVLLPSDQLLGVEELAVGSCAHLICRDIALVGYTNLSALNTNKSSFLQMVNLFFLLFKVQTQMLN